MGTLFLGGHGPGLGFWLVENVRDIVNGKMHTWGSGGKDFLFKDSCRLGILASYFNVDTQAMTSFV